MTVALLFGGQIHAEIPKNPTKAQIIASCEKPTVAERVALRGSKTRLEAAEVLQSIYQQRHDYWYNRVENHIDIFQAWEQVDIYNKLLAETNDLIEKLSTPPQKKGMK